MMNIICKDTSRRPIGFPHDHVHRILSFLILLLGMFPVCADASPWFLPIQCIDRQSMECVHLTPIGRYALLRKARPNIPAHFHAGVDIKRPSNDYNAEPVFPAAAGKVISIRDDGPYAQIIIEHDDAGTRKVWTVYEHIAGITVRLNEQVLPMQPIGRFMTTEELDRYGWQFDHLHFEIMTVAPRPRVPDASLPYRYFSTYSLACLTQEQLLYHYIDPLEFFRLEWSR
ncbi:MAG: M23 family metallopeptidase [Chitinispirillaceae bacterium]|nr:M23 family metallopeptidase [Chitinispirillaceae bacterium]